MREGCGAMSSHGRERSGVFFSAVRSALLEFVAIFRLLAAAVTAKFCINGVPACLLVSDLCTCVHHCRVVDMDVQRGMVMLQNPKARRDETPREFTFDAVYDWK